MPNWTEPTEETTYVVTYDHPYYPEVYYYDTLIEASKAALSIHEENKEDDTEEHTHIGIVTLAATIYVKQFKTFS